MEERTKLAELMQAKKDVKIRPKERNKDGWRKNENTSITVTEMRRWRQLNAL